MADSLTQRPFDNFRVAITDPVYFFGRSELLEAVRRSPFQVRILLGGRRIGKTSFLRAVEWSLLDLDFTKTAQLPEQQTSQSAAQARSNWVKKLFPTFTKLINPPSQPEQPTQLPEHLGESRRAFPVFISLQVEQPKDLDSFRYLFIARLREAIARWRNVPGAALRDMYRQFLSQVEGEVTLSFLSAMNIKFNLANPDYEKRLAHEDFRRALLQTMHELQSHHFEGVCFLLDGAEFIVSQPWANDAWSYLRGLKDTDTALKPFVGFVFSGYRDLKEYQQAVGSPLLNIAEVNWLTSLAIADTHALITQRSQEEHISLTESEIDTVIEWSGCHPYLTQQMLSLMFDNYRKEKARPTDNLKLELLRQHDRDFTAWWSDTQRSYSFGDTERKVYQSLVTLREDTIDHLSQQSQLSYGEVADALEVLTGTGVIWRTDDELYMIGAKLFQSWVAQQELPSTSNGS